MYRKAELRFLGHFVDVSGVRVDLSKVSAISEGLVALRCRIAIPQAMRQEILECKHGGQQSPRDCVVAQNINRYQTEGGNMPLLSDNQRTQRKEPQQPTTLAQRPWPKNRLV